MADVPNLPGFRSNNVSRQPVKQQFKYINGYAIENDMPTDTGVKRTLLDYEALQKAAPKRPQPGPSQLPKWLAHDREVYKFYGYFLESVSESNSESHRVRKVNVHYFKEDGSIQVTEPKLENSGIPQGIFVKRHKIQACIDGVVRVIGLSDIEVGDTLTFYGRTLKIVDCDKWTREDLLSRGFAVKDALPYPTDKYSASRAEFMQRETGADSTVYRGCRNNPMKEFMEATLGNASKNNRMLGQFLGKDRQVLRFDCYWDDTSQYKGDLRFFKLHYYLSSDEAEVIEKFDANSGYDPMAKLLQKSKLAKPGGGFVGFLDLDVGREVNLFKRIFCLIDADAFTRDWYKDNYGITLKPKIVKKKPVKVLPRDTDPPEHLVSSFGTEADSRRSWESLHPTPPGKDLAKMMEFDGKLRCYQTKLCDDGKRTVKENDKKRMFVFRYFLSDDTLAIFEPPARNSGFIGGKFLERGKHKNIDTGKFFDTKDFKLNGKIRICGRCFVVEAMSGEIGSKKPKSMGVSNMKAIITKVENKLRRQGASLARTFRMIDTDKSNTVTYDEMKEFLKAYFTVDELTDQEVFVVMRYFDSDGEGRIDYNEFAHKILGKDVGDNSYNTTAGADGGDTLAEGNLTMTEAELQKYQNILIAAVEKDRKAAFLELSMKIFKQKAENIHRDKLSAAFRTNDVEFKREISFPRFESILVQQDAHGGNSGKWSLRMDKKEARVVAEELFRLKGLTKNDNMSWDAFHDTFSFGK